MLSSISDDDTDVLNPGGFTGVVQHYGYGRLYNLYLDPKETRSYMIRKLVYIDAIIAEIGRHNARSANGRTSRPRRPGAETIARLLVGAGQLAPMLSAALCSSRRKSG